MAVSIKWTSIPEAGALQELFSVQRPLGTDNGNRYGVSRRWTEISRQQPARRRDFRAADHHPRQLDCQSEAFKFGSSPAGPMDSQEVG